MNPARVGYLLLPFALAAFATGCAHAQARVAPEVPGLEIPEPPPRSVETYSIGAPQTVEAPVGTPSTGIDEGVRAGVTATTGRATPSKPETTKPPAPARSDGTVVDTSKPAEEARPPVSPLQTQPRQKEEEVAAAIQSDLDRASAALTKIDYQRLATDPRAQYEMAKSYIDQGMGALKSKNLPFARILADKALVIAAELSGR